MARTIGWLDPLVWGMLRLKGSGMVEFFKSAMYISWHGYVDVTFVVVPIESESTIEGALPIDGEFVMGFDGVDEMKGISFAPVFYAEVIDTENESCLSGSMAPETGGERHWLVPCGG